MGGVEDLTSTLRQHGYRFPHSILNPHLEDLWQTILSSIDVNSVLRRPVPQAQQISTLFHRAQTIPRPPQYSCPQPTTQTMIPRQGLALPAPSRRVIDAPIPTAQQVLAAIPMTNSRLNQNPIVLGGIHQHISLQPAPRSQVHDEPSQHAAAGGPSANTQSTRGTDTEPSAGNFKIKIPLKRL